MVFSKEVVDLAAHQVALEDFLAPRDRLLEDLDALLRLLIERDLDEHGHADVQGDRIEQGHVFQDDPGLLELPDAAQTRRG